MTCGYYQTQEPGGQMDTVFNLSCLEVRTLMRQDSTLAQLIQRVGSCAIQFRDNRFESLTHVIIGQQLSTRAAQSIYQRVQALCKDVSPEAILSLTPAALKDAGLSRAKIQSITGLSQAVLEGSLVLEELDSLADSHIIQELSKIKGIGPWTAEMFLIFSMRRPNVLSFKDRGIQRSIAWLFDMPSCSKSLLQKCQEQWTPYNSVASFFLWSAIDQGLVG